MNQYEKSPLPEKLPAQKPIKSASKSMASSSQLASRHTLQAMLLLAQDLTLEEITELQNSLQRMKLELRR